MSKIRVVLADDHELMRLGIKNLLNSSPDITVVGEASDGVEALKAVERLHPDVLLLDMEMPVMDGVEAARQLRARNSPVKILVLSAYNDRQYIEAVLEQGASGYLTKDEAPGTVIDAVKAVAAGQRGWFSRKVSMRFSTTIDKDEQDKKPDEKDDPTTNSPEADEKPGEKPGAGLPPEDDAGKGHGDDGEADTHLPAFGLPDPGLP